MIFAAGLGTRLKPLTDTMPKALVPLCGKTLLEHTIERLKRAGYTDIVINVHHFADQIIEYLKANNNFGVRITISDERSMLLETGGAIKKARPILGSEPVLIHNVDIISNVDLKSLYEAHIASKSDATLLVSNRNSSRALIFDSNNNLVAWKNKTTGETKTPFKNLDWDSLNEYAFSGIHILSASLYSAMNKYPDKFPIMDFYLGQCSKKRLTASVATNLKLIDVGKLSSLEEAEKMLNQADL